MTPTVLRPYRPSDADELVRIALAAYAEFAPHYADWAAFSAGLARMPALADHGEILVAEMNGRLAGGVAYMPPGASKPAFFDADWPVIRMLAVDPACRGSGLGRRLTEACIDKARQRRCTVIALHTTPIMRVALALYQRMGFALVRAAPPIHGVAYNVYLKRLVS